jgi:hypothetical protein
MLQQALRKPPTLVDKQLAQFGVRPTALKAPRVEGCQRQAFPAYPAVIRFSEPLGTHQ